MDWLSCKAPYRFTPDPTCLTILIIIIKVIIVIIITIIIIIIISKGDIKKNLVKN